MKHLLSAILLLVSLALQAQNAPKNTNKNLSPDGTLGLSERNYTEIDSMTVDSLKRRLIRVGTTGVTSYTALNDRPASLSAFANDLNFRNQSQVQATTSQTWADSANSNKIYFGSGFSGLGTQANPLTVVGNGGTSVATDASVQAGSTNPVQSGGVKTYVDAATANLQSGINANTAKVATNTTDISSLSATLGTKQNASALGAGIAAYLTGLPGYGPGKVLSSDLTWIQPAATTAGQTQLSAPTLAVGTATTSTVPLVIGSAASATAYTVQYDVSSTFTSPTSFTAASGSYTVTDLSANTTYYFRVKATASGFSDSPYSATSTATTAPAPTPNVQLAAPTLSVGAATSASLALNWTASPNATSYSLQQDVSTTFSAPTTVYSGAATSFTAQGLTANTTYYYRVQATAGTGFTASAFSNTATATTATSTTVSAPLTLAPVTSWNLTGNASNNAVVTNTNSVSHVAATGVSYVVANQKTTGLGVAIISMDVSTTVASGIIGLDQGIGWVSNNGFDISIQYTDSRKVIIQSNNSYLAQPVINGVTNLRIRTDGTNAYGEYSTNSGSTWTAVPAGKVTQLPNQYLKGVVQAKGVSIINVQSAGLN